MLHRKKNRWLYGCMAGITAISINLATPTVSQAGWLDNILRGVLIWGVQSYQISNLSDADEMDFGKQIHNEIIGSRQGQVQLYNNTKVVNYIEEIGERLAANSRRPGIDYRFFVVDDDSINAFATMGGYTYVNTGLIEAAANEAELASVIGHEIAHIEEKHSIGQMQAQARNQGLLAAAGLDSSQIVQLGVAIAFDYPHSRSDERDADDLGFELLTKAGYAPDAMASFMTTLMNESGGNGGSSFLSTHPGTAERIDTLQKNADDYVADSDYTKGSFHDIGLNEQHYRNKISPLQ
ncbi:peptidase M48 Ste24p [[Leptolyngbya] sp. PCC 7376]|uniref:M48 family metallopeptidase n=1 Tax=[Leptolyngbya] sp. PCC 7376 TaxID=111781 RepID=UPI00029F0BF0|nr:M48 family metallopeptidase [[Leptolyngbya] sp. PCC 7376]AFY36674.1 peptidase M48 Ste24p [[Leptolyngbya] sp. PCC 7376]